MLTTGPWTISLTWEKVQIKKHIFWQSWVCTITLIKRENTHYLAFENPIYLICKNLYPLYRYQSLWMFWAQFEDLEKRIFKCNKCIFAILVLSPLEKGHSPSLEQTWILLTKECFVPSLIEIGPVVQRRQQRRLQRRTTDKYWSEKLTWAFSSGEVKSIVREIFPLCK